MPGASEEGKGSGVLGQGGHRGPWVCVTHRELGGAEGRTWRELLERLPSLSLGCWTGPVSGLGGPRISAQELVLERSLVRHS